jgi:3-oxoadipate enol-lactonase
MTSVRLCDGTLDIVETGAGKPLVLLHSLLADRVIFDKVVPALAKQRRVIVPDLPGFGGSSSAGSTIEGIADRIAGLFDALDLGTTADVLGNGFGGFVASTLAIRHGVKFDRLVLADTGVGFSPEGKQSFYAMAERVRQSGMEAIVDVALKRLFPEDFIAVNPDIMAERRNALVKTNPEFFAEACYALAALDLTADIGRIRNPTLVVVGERDAATPPEMARTLAKALPNADLIEMPGCGHAPMAQAPEAFIKAIAKFLDLK